MVYVWLGLLGLVVGGFGTVIGAGGGFLLMPILAVLYPTDSPALLSSISLAVVFLNALSGSIGYARMKRIDYRAGSVFAAATLPGAVLGAIATGYLERKTYDLILGTAIVGAAVFILIASNRLRKVREEDQAPGGDEHAPPRYNVKLGVLISVAVGFLSSLLGIGGGIIHVPALVFVLGFPVHVATATSHFVLAITSGAGTGVHVWQGVFHHGLRRTAALGIGVMVGAQVGARMSKHAPNVMILRGLAVALIVVGIRIIWNDVA